MTKSQTIYKSFLIRFYLNHINGRTVASVRLQNISDPSDIHYFPDLEAAMTFWRTVLSDSNGETDVPDSATPTK